MLRRLLALLFTPRDTQLDRIEARLVLIERALDTLGIELTDLDNRIANLQEHNDHAG